MCAVDECETSAFATGLCRSHYNKAHYAANRDKALARTKAWAKANPEKIQARNAARDPQKLRDSARAYYWRDRLRGIASQANSRAKRLGVAGRITADGIRARFAYFADRCWICLEPGANSIDHVKPLNKGGLNIHANIRPAHLGCNAARSWEGRR